MVRPFPYPHRILIRLLTGLVLTILLWAFIGEIDIVVTAEGRVVADGYTKTLQPSQSGTVRSIRIKEGDLVKEGATLLELDTEVSEAELAAIKGKIAQAKLELSRLDAELSGKAATYDQNIDQVKRGTQEALRQSRDLTYAYRISEAKSGAEAKRSALGAGIALLTGLESRQQIAREKEERARKYVDVLPRFQYLQLKDDLFVIERDMAAQKQTNQKFQHELDEALRHLQLVTSERRTSIFTEINERQALITQLESDLTKAEKHLADNEIRAPIEGYIQKVNVTTIGATVSASEPIMLLVPKGAPLVVEAFVPNEDKGFTRIGQPVEIKLDAFPFQKYGKVRGTLTWISPDAEASADANRTLVGSRTSLQKPIDPTARMVYRAKIQPEAITGSLSLAPGMTVKVDIFSDRRRIIDFFLFPLTEAIEDGLRVR